MRTIIAGSRTATNYALLCEAIEICGWRPTVVISGGAKGADKLGELWAKTHGVKLEVYPADWDRHGRQAGFVRNSVMAEQADALVALWDGKSKGTQHMISTARAKHLLIFVYESK